MFRDQFDGCIKSKAFRKALCGDPVLDGMLAQTAIGVTYKTYKESKQFRALCGLTILKSGYNPEIILEEEVLQEEDFLVAEGLPVAEEVREVFNK